MFNVQDCLVLRNSGNAGLRESGTVEGHKNVGYLAVPPNKWMGGLELLTPDAQGHHSSQQDDVCSPADPLSYLTPAGKVMAFCKSDGIPTKHSLLRLSELIIIIKGAGA